MRAEEPEVLDALRFLTQRARQPFRTKQSIDCEVAEAGGVLTVRVDGELVDRAPDPAAARDTLFAHTHRRLLSQFPEHALVRGAVVGVNGQRVLLTGERGCGLTSLALRLLMGGAKVEGDALALLGGDGLTPLPRRLLVRDPAPAFAELVRDAPVLREGEDVVHGFDPTEAGFSWEIRRGGIDACIAVQPNHGGQTRLSAAGQTETVREVVGGCAPPAGGGSAWLKGAVSLLGGARCMKLQLGQSARASELILQTL